MWFYLLAEKAAMGTGGVVTGVAGLAFRFCPPLVDFELPALEFGPPGKLTRRDIGEDGVEARMDRITFLRRDEPDVREHGRVGLAPGNVKRREPPIERDGLAELQHQIGGTGGETAPPPCLGKPWP